MQQAIKKHQLDNEIKEQAGAKGVGHVNADEEAFLSLHIRYLEEQLTNDTQNRTERKKFAQKIFFLTLLWICFIILVVILQGAPVNFSLSDKVMITLLAGSSINIVALMAIVIRYLFPPNLK